MLVVLFVIHHLLGSCLVLGAIGAALQIGSVASRGASRRRSEACVPGGAERSRGHQRLGPVALAGILALCTLLPLHSALREAIDLALLLLSEEQAGGNWEVVDEVPEDVTRDADFLAWGVDAQRARHYTRHERRRVEVCSIEIWHFLTEQHAQRALREIDYPLWEIGGSALHLVLVRGLTAKPGMPPRRGVFPDCRQLGQRVRERVEVHAH